MSSNSQILNEVREKLSAEKESSSLNKEEAILRLENVRKVYGTEVEVEALKGVDLTIPQGTFTAIIGPSGSGKSTLMFIIGCLLRPSDGDVMIREEEGYVKISELSESELAEIRGRKLGFVFQQFNLLPNATALRNASLPLLYQGVRADERKNRAKEVLERVGLGNRLDHLPTELSGGERQRVAIGRALAPDPAIVLADEPTGNVDTETGEGIMKIFQDLNDRGRTIVMVSHEPHIAEWAERRIRFVDGQITSQGENFEKKEPRRDVSE